MTEGLTYFLMGIIAGGVIALIDAMIEGKKKKQIKKSETLDRLPFRVDLRREEAKKLDEIEASSIETLTLEEIAEATPQEFNELNLTKVQNESEVEKKRVLSDLMSDWLKFVHHRINEAAAYGEHSVNVNCDLNDPADMNFHKGYDRNLMIVVTTKLLLEKGFKVHVYEFEGLSQYKPLPRFIMEVSWDKEEIA